LEVLHVRLQERPGVPGGQGLRRALPLIREVRSLRQDDDLRRMPLRQKAVLNIRCQQVRAPARTSSQDGPTQRLVPNVTKLLRSVNRKPEDIAVVDPSAAGSSRQAEDAEVLDSVRRRSPPRSLGGLFRRVLRQLRVRWSQLLPVGLPTPGSIVVRHLLWPSICRDLVDFRIDSREVHQRLTPSA
jgi:hypothetical protein